VMVVRTLHVVTPPDPDPTVGCGAVGSAALMPWWHLLGTLITLSQQSTCKHSHYNTHKLQQHQTNQPTPNPKPSTCPSTPKKKRPLAVSSTSNSSRAPKQDERIIDTAIGITDQVAKESKDSTASSHPLHDEDTNATSGGAASLAHKANPGPVIADNLGEPASKEELKKRSDELNKK
jgi:hypothetical protein